MSLLLSVFSREVMVKPSDLEMCGHQQACVTDHKDCGPRPSASTQKNLNMSCYYENQRKLRTVTCEWSDESESHTEPDISLIFSSNRITSCSVLFNPMAVFNVTARIKTYMGSEIWSQPYTAYLYKAIKLSPPVLTVLGSTEDTVDLSWVCSYVCTCKIKYKDNSAQRWLQAPDFVSTHRARTLTYTLRDLLPFTVYRAAVSCTGSANLWSAWSTEVTARTLGRAPSRPPNVCYRLNRTDSGASIQLQLMWMDLHPEATDHILGHQVSYELVKRQQDRSEQNITEGTALVVVEDGNCNITVRAYNTAGLGPSTHLNIDTRTQKKLPLIRNLWASSSSNGLLVQWETLTDPPPSVQPVNLFAVQWRPKTRPSAGHWMAVDNFSTSAVIHSVDPGESYLVSVFPIFNQQCGSPQSLPVSLQQGALMEAVKLKVVDITETTVTVMWVWQWKLASSHDRVDGYSVMLRRDSERKTLSLYPDQWQHTFINLRPNTEYSLLLLADNASRSILTVTTDFDIVPVVATVTPLLLLTVTVFIISILSRTVYKSYFFPPISSPRGSTTGQWLMDPNHQTSAERNILYIDDFRVMDVLGEKSLITFASTAEPEKLHEDVSLLSFGHLISKLDPQYVSDAPVFEEPVLMSPQSYHPVYSVNCPLADQDHHFFRPVELRETDSASQANSCFPQKEEESRRLTKISRQRETVMKSVLHEFMLNTPRLGVYQMSCEAQYVVNTSSLQGKRDVETNCSLTCDSDYIANSCFTTEPTDGNRTAH
ncbi:interleukin-6 receptor subunit beta [Xyrichtys novacula]|nr:interleukin-6 receptor subunit beta [Xyrichtys novacula]